MNDATGGGGTRRPPTRIVLVGLSGAGKSSVGAAAVRALPGWTHVDLDAEIERRAGRSVAEIFARQGEAAFRKLERAVTQGLETRERVVVSTGGGWVELGAPVESIRGVSDFVYLRVSPAVAAARIAAQGGGRPLLAGGETTQKLENLLARREPLYLQSQHTLSVDSLSEAEVVSYIVALASGGTRD